jgi:hypothetical protein
MTKRVTKSVTKRIRVRVVHDSSPQNPRGKGEDTMGTMAWMRNSRWTLDDETIHDDYYNTVSEYVRSNLLNIDEDSDALLTMLSQSYIEERFVILGLRYNDYGANGSRIVVDDFDWEDGKREYDGIMYMPKAKVVEEYGDYSEDARKRAIDYMKAEAKEYEQYINNDIWGFVIEEAETDDDEADDDDLDWEETEAMWGFYTTDVKENGMMEYVPKELHEQLLKAAQDPDYDG